MTVSKIMGLQLQSEFSSQRENTTPLPKSTISFGPQEVIALDSIRCLAAFYVVLHHLAGRFELPFPIGLILRFGQEAVIIFFLLSGVVIFASENERALNPKGYYLRRLRRIYPTLLFAMALSTLIALDNGTLATQFSSLSLFGTLLGLQDVADLKPGVIVAPYLSNVPLWSLSYELFFYLIFPIVLRFWYVSKVVTNHAVGAVCCIAYVVYLLAPNHLSLLISYFLLWWSGAMAAHAFLHKELSLRSIWVPLFWLAVLTCTSAIPLLISGYLSPGVYPALMVRHFGVALLILLLLCVLPRSLALRIPANWAKAVTFGASISFGVYVLHYPLLLSWDRISTSQDFALAFALLFFLAWVSEKWIYRFIPRVSAD